MPVAAMSSGQHFDNQVEWLQIKSDVAFNFLTDTACYFQCMCAVNGGQPCGWAPGENPVPCSKQKQAEIHWELEISRLT